MPSEILKSKPSHPVMSDFDPGEIEQLTDDEVMQVLKNTCTDPVTGEMMLDGPRLPRDRK